MGGPHDRPSVWPHAEEETSLGLDLQVVGTGREELAHCQQSRQHQLMGHRQNVGIVHGGLVPQEHVASSEYSCTSVLLKYVLTPSITPLLTPAYAKLTPPTAIA